jgi:hypothetical protein
MATITVGKSVLNFRHDVAPCVLPEAPDNQITSLASVFAEISCGGTGVIRQIEHGGSHGGKQ